MNAAIILGRLTRDPVIKATQSGMTIARFTLAVNRLNKKGQNPEADFINCVAFGKTADVIGNYVYKGQRALIEGRLQIRSYDGKDGQKHWITEVIADHLEFVEPKGSSAPSSPMDAFGPGGGTVSQPAKPPAPKVEQQNYFEEEFPF